MRDKAGLPTVERMLTAAAKRRAERSRVRRRGTGFAVIAFAGLALAGSAAAATGLWDPLPFGGGQPEVSKSVGQDGAAAPTASAFPRGPAFSPGVSPSGSARKRGRTRGASGHAAAPSIDLPAATPVLPPPSQGGEEDPSGGPRGDGTPHGGSDGGSHPAHPGEGAGGPGSGGGGSPEGPGEEKGVPGPAQISVVCTPETVTVGQAAACRATVRGSGQAPTGQVLFKTAGTGSFSANPCTLETGSCSVSYTPNAAGIHQMSAIYGGDGANAPDSTSFQIKSLP